MGDVIRPSQFDCPPSFHPEGEKSREEEKEPGKLNVEYGVELSETYVRLIRDLCSSKRWGTGLC